MIPWIIPFLLFVLPLQSAVTYAFSGGRFGDNLLSYMHAKWVAYRYDIPLLYKPFPYSDQLALDDLEMPYSPEEFSHIHILSHLLEIKRESSTLYILPYFPESLNDRMRNPQYPYVPVEWKEEGFRALLRTLISPKVPFSPWEFPKNCVTVAVHVRRGGSFDSPQSYRTDPLRFPSDQFYIEQIRYLYEQFQQKPLYVYLFTDDLSPEALVSSFQQMLPHIRIDSRKQGNDSVLEDFFAMLQFDCLIRPESNYSLVASLLGDFKVIIYPLHFYWENGLPVIDQVEIINQG